MTSYITIKLEGNPGSGRTVIEKALRRIFAEAGIITEDLKTLGGDKIDHQFQIRLPKARRDEIAKYGL